MNRRAAIVGGLVVVGGIAWFFASGTDKPGVLAEVAGCYRSVDPGRPVGFEVLQSGWLAARRDRVRVTGYRDKDGDALRPEKGVVFDKADPSRIDFDKSAPTPIRAGDNYRSLTLLDARTGDDVVFARVPCTVPEL